MLDETAGVNEHRDSTQPLVSIGMPVYNRPDGLRRSLSCITSQTHQNIEIIISDNCSPSEKIREIAESFMLHDDRISYFRQETALPIAENFKFVLQRARGGYFMWAADDDEWADDFIEQCLHVLSMDDVVSVMSHFDTHYRFDGRREVGRMPELSLEQSQSENAHAFLKCITPSLFYGLHRRHAINFFLQDEFFDFYDCYFMLHLILSGRVAVIEPKLYTAGIDAPSYQVKPAKKNRITHLQYSPLLFKAARLVASASLKGWEKASLMIRLLYVVMTLFLFHEIKRVVQRA